MELVTDEVSHVIVSFADIKNVAMDGALLHLEAHISLAPSIATSCDRRSREEELCSSSRLMSDNFFYPMRFEELINIMNMYEMINDFGRVRFDTNNLFH